jgi:hypothetical protein
MQMELFHHIQVQGTIWFGAFWQKTWRRYKAKISGILCKIQRNFLWRFSTREFISSVLSSVEH